MLKFTRTGTENGQLTEYFKLRKPTPQRILDIQTSTEQPKLTKKGLSTQISQPCKDYQTLHRVKYIMKE